MNKKFYSNKWEKDDKNKTKTHSYAANSTHRTPAQPKREKQTSETTSLQLRNIERKTESYFISKAEAGNLQKLLKSVFCFFFLDNSIVTISGVGGIRTLVLFIGKTGNATKLQCSWLLKSQNCLQLIFLTLFLANNLYLISCRTVLFLSFFGFPA